MGAVESLVPEGASLTTEPQPRSLLAWLCRHLDCPGESKSAPTDGWKSIFWPTVENAWDVDYLGRQGFWICLWIAVFQLIVSALTGNPIVIAVGFAEALVFLIGGMGVRENNWPAAALIFCLFFLNQLYGLASGQFLTPGGDAGISILRPRWHSPTSVPRFLLQEWKCPIAEGEDQPTRFNDSFRDKLADQLPPQRHGLALPDSLLWTGRKPVLLEPADDRRGWDACHPAPPGRSLPTRGNSDPLKREGGRRAADAAKLTMPALPAQPRTPIIH